MAGLSTGSVVAGYRISRLIGRGATGAVYLAEDADGRQVALKVLIPELANDARFRERFLREARIAASLDEPHVVPTLATGEHDGTLYLVMRVRRRARPARDPQARGPARAPTAPSSSPARSRARSTRRTRSGSSTATSSRATSSSRGRPRASTPTCATSASPSTSRRSAASRASAPSSAPSPTSRPSRSRAAPIDARADVYSLGCMLFECLTGDAPFARESEVAAVYAHMNEPPPRVSDVRPGVPGGFDDVDREGAREGPGRSLRELRRARRGERGGAARRAPRRTASGAGRASCSPRSAAAAIASPRPSWPRSSHESGGRAPRRHAPRDRAEDARARSTPRRTRSSGRSPFTSQPWDVAFDAAPPGCCSATSAAWRASIWRSRKMLSSAKLPFSPGGITTGGGSAWVTEDNGPGLVRLDGATGQDRRDDVGPDPGRPRREPDGHRVRRGLGVGRARPRDGARRPRRAAASSGASRRRSRRPPSSSPAGPCGWRAPRTGGSSRSTPRRTGSRRRRRCTATVTDLAVDDGSVWVSVVPDNVVFRLSPDDGSVLATMPGRPVAGVALGRATGSGSPMPRGARSSTSTPRAARDVLRRAARRWWPRCHGGLLWVSARAPRAGRRGVDGQQELRIPLDDDAHRQRRSRGDRRPGLRAARVLHLCLPPELPGCCGAAGRTLRPEVAAAMPAVSADGRTYTFRVRPGFRFSPPSGQAVTAETFRYTIERALSPKLATGGRPNAVAQLLGDIVGASAYASGKAPHIRGITVRGRHDHVPADTGRRRLPRAAPPSFFCPVPIGTPVVAGGDGSTPIAMAGPYYVASASGDQVMVERNPNYAGDAAASDRAHRLHGGRHRGRGRLARRARPGRLRQRHTVGDDPTGPLAPGRRARPRLRAREPGGSSRAARATSPSPAPGVDAIAFNTRRPLFRDARMRRAVAYALDRAALARVFGEQPSDRLVPRRSAARAETSPSRTSPIW